MERITKTFICLSANRGRAVLAPVDGTGDSMGRLWKADSRLLVEVPDAEVFTEGRKYEVEIKER